MTFYSNSGESFPISSKKDIEEYVKKYLDAFYKLEIYDGKVLVYFTNEPMPICVGSIK